MRIRQKINNKCLYDRLLSYNKDIATTDIACVIELLTRETKTVLQEAEYPPHGSGIYITYEERCAKVQKETNFKNCEKCIQQFLNKEV